MCLYKIVHAVRLQAGVLIVPTYIGYIFCKKWTPYKRKHVNQISYCKGIVEMQIRMIPTARTTICYMFNVINENVEYSPK